MQDIVFNILSLQNCINYAWRLKPECLVSSKSGNYHRKTSDVLNDIAWLKKQAESESETHSLQSG